jgi:hypothetical protein
MAKRRFANSDHMHVNREEIHYYGTRLHLYNAQWRRLAHCYNEDCHIERDLYFEVNRYADSVNYYNIHNEYVIR